MTEQAMIHLLGTDGVGAVGDDRAVFIRWPENVPDDHLIVRIGRWYARTLGLELRHYERAGTERRWSDSIAGVMRSSKEALVPGSYQVFAHPDNAEPQASTRGVEFGDCHLVVPGFADVHGWDELPEFLRQFTEDG